MFELLKHCNLLFVSLPFRQLVLSQSSHYETEIAQSRAKAKHFEQFERLIDLSRVCIPLKIQYKIFLSQRSTPTLKYASCLLGFLFYRLVT